MAVKFTIPFYKQAPFIRLLLPFIAGILLQWYTYVPITITVNILIIGSILLWSFKFLPIHIRYAVEVYYGIILNVVIISAAMALTQQKNSINKYNYYGKYYNNSSKIVATITQPLVENENTYTTQAKVEMVINDTVTQTVSGKLLLYFSKKDSITLPAYGDRIMLQARLQNIQNSGNPGAFNYGQYMVFQQTQQQVYLSKSNFILLQNTNSNKLYSFIFFAQQKVIAILKKYIVGNKKATGIAEALLIGYKQDLDKDLVQAYSNTGVVHIIAISGMHLGLIYAGLVWLLARVPYVKKSKIATVFIILTSLWLFSLITGASASVLRSAVMFTCITVGKNFFRQANIYNSLSASAFLLLCYNPFLMWDVGFQLSYLAIVGIVWLQKPIENLWFSKHWIAQKVWQMCSITIAAQILTLPICIYYFHQIPILFLLTNLICVPLSTLILFAEILLIAVSWFEPVAFVLGKIIYWLTLFMNFAIEFCNKLPFSLIDTIHATLLTTFILYVFTILLSAALLRKSKKFLLASILLLSVFMGLWSFGKIKYSYQKKLVVYNVNKHTAIDFIEGKKYWFYGDDTLKIDGALQNFNLKPARILYQIKPSADTFTSIKYNNKLWQFYNYTILHYDTTVQYLPISSPIPINLLVISNSPYLNLFKLCKTIQPQMVLIDGSNTLGKTELWKKQCEELHLRFHSTAQMGAYIVDVE